MATKASDSGGPSQPVLDLSTLIPDRPPIRIDGQLYHLRSPDELTLAESHRFSRWGQELERLGKASETLGHIGEARGDTRLEDLLRVVARAALADVPEDVAAKLTPHHCLAIVEVFTVLLLGRRMRLAGAIASAVRSIGQKSSRGSSAPMAGSPDGGSMAPPPHSSGPT